MQTILHDLRFAFRTLRRRRAFAAVAVATIGLGVGAATSIYSVVDGVLFRPLPFGEPGRLVAVWQTYPDWLKEPILASSWDKINISIPEYRDWRAHQTVFEEVAIFSPTSVLLSGHGAPEQVQVLRASSSLLSVLRVRAALGRGFLPGEDQPGGPAIVMLSHEAWTTRFGADSAAIGTIVRLDDRPFEIVGVLPPGLTLGRTAAAAQPFWVPAAQDSAEAVQRGTHSYRGLARIKAGVTLEQAALEMGRIFNNDGDPRSESGARVEPLHEDQTREVRAPLLILLGAVGLLLLIACVNVATLLLGEAAAREHEMAARVALGASRGRLVRQLLTESLALAALGVVLGTLLAYMGTKALVALAPARIPGMAEVRIDLRVLAFALTAAATTGILFGLAPALMLSRTGPASLLRGGAGQSARRRGGLQRSLVAAELALSLVLLVGAGLLSRSFARLTAVDPGFRTDRLLTVRFALPRATARDSLARREYYRAAIERLAALPGVAQVTGGSNTPFSGGTSSTSIEIEGRTAGPDAAKPSVQQRVVVPGFFAALGIPLRAGRTFSDDDRSGAPLVVVISESAARRDWPNESALGKRVKFQGEWRTVVGIVGDVRYSRLSADIEPTLYTPIGQRLQGLSFLVRTRGPAGAQAGAVRAVLREVDPNVPVTTIDTMDELLERSFAEERYRTMLISMFGILAGVLAAVGMYGVTARAVSRRTREVGIRMALGATGRSIVTLIVSSTLSGVAVGTCVGVVGALVTTRVLSPFLFGVSATDPLTYATIVMLLIVLGVVASWLPARRAARLQPATVLRAQ